MAPELPPHERYKMIGCCVIRFLQVPLRKVFAISGGSGQRSGKPSNWPYCASSSFLGAAPCPMPSRWPIRSAPIAAAASPVAPGRRRSPKTKGSRVHLSKVECGAPHLEAVSAWPKWVGPTSAAAKPNSNARRSEIAFINHLRSGGVHVDERAPMLMSRSVFPRKNGSSPARGHSRGLLFLNLVRRET